MNTATLSTKGQLVIPSRCRKALHLQPGDTVEIQLEGGKLVIQRSDLHRARLVAGKFGRRVLVASGGAPEMTPGVIRSLRDDD
ncbi:MAG: AbrB/MazE/SpoVT family DNA-binding domain-containing protein [Terrimicrobiaceae bacterium]|nr:AbrB/MazE/SpoVT family DNA-binding domain-containing protein [Terrimicrobiaceae bacterium]